MKYWPFIFTIVTLSNNTFSAPIFHTVPAREEFEQRTSKCSAVLTDSSEYQLGQLLEYMLNQADVTSNDSLLKASISSIVTAHFEGSLEQLYSFAMAQFNSVNAELTAAKSDERQRRLKARKRTIDILLNYSLNRELEKLSVQLALDRNFDDQIESLENYFIVMRANLNGKQVSYGAKDLKPLVTLVFNAFVEAFPEFKESAQLVFFGSFPNGRANWAKSDVDYMFTEQFASVFFKPHIKPDGGLTLEFLTQLMKFSEIANQRLAKHFGVRNSKKWISLLPQVIHGDVDLVTRFYNPVFLTARSSGVHIGVTRYVTP